MKVEFLDLARRELDDVFGWYEAQVPGLGYDFLLEFDRAVGRVLAYPQSAAVIRANLRRVVIRRFPYGVIYGVDGERIVIVAVANLHREPHYWIERKTYSIKPDRGRAVQERRARYEVKRKSK